MNIFKIFLISIAVMVSIEQSYCQDQSIQIHGPTDVGVFTNAEYTVDFVDDINTAEWNTSNSGANEISRTTFSIILNWTQSGSYFFEYDLYTNAGVHYYGSITVNVTALGPATPLALAATNVNSNSFTANWQNSDGATSYLLDVIVGSRPYFDDNSVYQGNYKNFIVSSTSASIAGLQQGTIYHYRVRAVNSNGTSEASSTINVLTPGPPPKPVSLAATNIRAKSFDANWQAIAGEDGLTIYKVDVATDINFNNFIYNNMTVTGQHGIDVQNLVPNTTYYYRIRAINDAGPSINSNVITVTTALNPIAPIASNATNVTSIDFVANWLPVQGATNYEIDVSEKQDFSSQLAVYPYFWNSSVLGTTTSLTVTGLTGGIEYYYRVRTVNSNGTSGNSNTIMVITVPTIPDVPIANTATNLSYNSFTASWSNVELTTGYELEVSTSKDFTSFIPGYNTISVTGLNYNVTGLTEKTIYYYRVRAVNAQGASGYSNVIQAINLDENYIRSMDVQVANVTTMDQVIVLDQTRKITQTSFFDGLGRPIRTVTMQGSPAQKDIIQPVVYDQYGRENVQYLPFVSSGTDGWYKPDFANKNDAAYSTGDQYQFYQNAQKTAHDSQPFSETRFEPSPLNRPVKHGAPGSAWQPDGVNDYTSTDYTIKVAYQTNAANEVLLFTYDASTGSLNTGSLQYYDATQLYANKTKDEHGSEVIEYVDKESRTVCKKVQYGVDANATKLYAETYYIYNDLGDLVVVLPPEAVKTLLSSY